MTRSCLLLWSCKIEIQATEEVKLVTNEDRKVILYRIKLQNTSTLTDSAVTQLQRDAENSGVLAQSIYRNETHLMSTVAV